MQELRKEGLLKGNVWTTLFVAWPGGGWTPPTSKALMNLVDHCPDYCTWSVSSMDYDVNKNWEMLTQAILLGGHVRVGWEDNPFLAPGVYAEHCAQLVEKIIRISRELGREIASPDEARKIIG